MSVDLPEPEGPITARKSPSFTASDTSSTARTVASPLPYTLLTSRRRMISAASAARAARAATAATEAAAEPTSCKLRPVPVVADGIVLVMVAITTWSPP